MRAEFKALDVPQSTAASPGTAINVENYCSMSLLLYGWTVGTLRVHASNDGINYADLTGGITSEGFVDLPACVRSIRMVCSVNISVGTAAASFGGRNSRTDSA